MRIRISKSNGRGGLWKQMLREWEEARSLCILSVGRLVLPPRVIPLFVGKPVTFDIHDAAGPCRISRKRIEADVGSKVGYAVECESAGLDRCGLV